MRNQRLILDPAAPIQYQHGNQVLSMYQNFIQSISLAPILCHIILISAQDLSFTDLYRPLCQAHTDIRLLCAHNIPHDVIRGQHSIHVLEFQRVLTS